MEIHRQMTAVEAINLDGSFGDGIGEPQEPEQGSTKSEVTGLPSSSESFIEEWTVCIGTIIRFQLRNRIGQSMRPVGPCRLA